MASTGDDQAGFFSAVLPCASCASVVLAALYIWGRVFRDSPPPMKRMGSTLALLSVVLFFYSEMFAHNMARVRLFVSSFGMDSNDAKLIELALFRLPQVALVLAHLGVEFSYVDPEVRPLLFILCLSGLLLPSLLALLFRHIFASCVLIISALALYSCLSAKKKK